MFTIADGHDYEQILDVLKTMEDWDPADRRPMIVIGKTTKGYWPAPVPNQIVGYPSHPFGFKMNSDYIVALAKTFEERYGVKFEGMSARARSPTRANGCSSSRRTWTSRCRCSTRTASATGWPIASSRSATRSVDKIPLRIDVKRDPFLDERLRVANLPDEPQKLDGQEPGRRRGEDRQDRAVPEGRRSGRRAARRSPRSSSG